MESADVKSRDGSARHNLPEIMRLLVVSGHRRFSQSLHEAFASDSAASVDIRDVSSAAATLAALRQSPFDGVLLWHDPPILDALEAATGIRALAAETAIVMIGAESEGDWAALAVEAGADAYLQWKSVTTRHLIWTFARATAFHEAMAKARGLREQRDRAEERNERLVRELLDSLARHSSSAAVTSGEQSLLEETRRCLSSGTSLKKRYGELLRAYCLMDSGALDGEVAALAAEWHRRNHSPSDCLRTHLTVLEEMLDGIPGQGRYRIAWRSQQLLWELLLEFSVQNLKNLNSAADHPPLESGPCPTI